MNNQNEEINRINKEYKTILRQKKEKDTKNHKLEEKCENIKKK